MDAGETVDLEACEVCGKERASDECDWCRRPVCDKCISVKDEHDTFCFECEPR